MDQGKVILFTQFGSHIYGTNVPTSDQDFKGIFLPRGNDILLQRAAKTSINMTTKKDATAKNSPDDIDTEYFSLQGFVRLCDEGQTMAVDLLFTPKKFWKSHTWEWEYIQQNRAKLIHKGTSAFAGYCQTQAAKYGVKGSYISALKAAIAELEQLPLWKRLSEFEPTWQKLAEAVEHVHIVPIAHPKSGNVYNYLTIRNTKVEYNCTVKYALEIFKDKLEKYGARAKMAETNEGVDWKACMHAVRVCGEANELLATGQITFPRPDAEILLKIRKGELPYKEVADMIEAGVVQMKDAQAKSVLPESIDRHFWERYVCMMHAGQIVSHVCRDVGGSHRTGHHEEQAD